MMIGESLFILYRCNEYNDYVSVFCFLRLRVTFYAESSSSVVGCAERPVFWRSTKTFGKNWSNTFLREGRESKPTKFIILFGGGYCSWSNTSRVNYIRQLICYRRRWYLYKDRECIPIYVRVFVCDIKSEWEREREREREREKWVCVRVWVSLVSMTRIFNI